MSLNYRLTAFTACMVQIRTHTREQISDDFVSRSPGPVGSCVGGENFCFLINNLGSVSSDRRTLEGKHFK